MPSGAIPWREGYREAGRGARPGGVGGRSGGTPRSHIACSSVPGVIIEIVPEGNVGRRVRWLVVLPVLALGGACRCGGVTSSDEPFVSAVPEGPGAAVEVLVDCSGSMQETWHGQAKSDAARRALAEALRATGEFRRLHPDRPVKVGVLAFSSSVDEVLPLRDWDAAAVDAALAAIPGPSGRTAIGDALDRAREALYGSGMARKYVLAITDGENTAGHDPEPVARAIARRSRGAVSISMVAVDMDAREYRFITELGGDVLQADDPAALQAAVKQIYEGKILAEAVDAEAGEAAPERAAPAPTPSTGSAK
jgi:hypothetical protein